MRTCQMLYPKNTSSRRTVSMDGMWNFQLDWKQEGETKNWKDGLPDPDRIPVPASFQDFYTDKETREFTGDEMDWSEQFPDFSLSIQRRNLSDGRPGRISRD